MMATPGDLPTSRGGSSDDDIVRDILGRQGQDAMAILGFSVGDSPLDAATVRR